MSNHGSSPFATPPAGVVDFLQRVFDFAETLEPTEGQALRRLVRAGLLADDGTITAVLHDDTGGFGLDADLQLAAEPSGLVSERGRAPAPGFVPLSSRMRSLALEGRLTGLPFAVCAAATPEGTGWPALPCPRRSGRSCYAAIEHIYRVLRVRHGN